MCWQTEADMANAKMALVAYVDWQNDKWVVWGTKIKNANVHRDEIEENVNIKISNLKTRSSSSSLFFLLFISIPFQFWYLSFSNFVPMDICVFGFGPSNY